MKKFLSTVLLSGSVLATLGLCHQVVNADSVQSSPTPNGFVTTEPATAPIQVGKYTYQVGVQNVAL